MSPPSGPPYALPHALPGGLPTPIPDIPISTILLTIYLAFATTNMTLLQLNRRQNHKFLISGALFGFSMSRIVTCALRIALAVHGSNVPLALAAEVFVNAGVLVLYGVNLLFAVRLLRARQPRIGWSPLLRGVVRGMFAMVGVALVLVVYAVVQGAYTVRPGLGRVCRDIQLGTATFLLVFTVLPFVGLGVVYGLPRSREEEDFGRGSIRAKCLLLGTTTALCVVIAGFKTGTAWMSPREVGMPAWYQGKAAFYVFYFGLEVVVLAVFTGGRVDRRFWVPDGSSGVRGYGGRKERDQGMGEV